MEDTLVQEFKALRGFIESSSMATDEQLRAKVMLSNIRCNADNVIRDTDTTIERVSNEKVEDMKKDFKKAYTELANNYTSLEQHKDKLIQQLSEINSKCGQLQIQLIEKDNSVVVETVSEKDKEILNHIDKVKEGNISFKDDVDMSLIVNLYMKGCGAGKIVTALKEKEIIVARQTVVNRLTRIGLWENKVNWVNSKRTDNELDYIKKHNIDINSLVAIVNSYYN